MFTCLNVKIQMKVLNNLKLYEIKGVLYKECKSYEYLCGCKLRGKLKTYSLTIIKNEQHCFRKWQV